MGKERDSAKNEHTQNIRAGLSVLKTMYGLHYNQFDYLDLAVDALRDIRHFGTTEYIAMSYANEKGEIFLPCSADIIDAVVTERMSRKIFDQRVPAELPTERDDVFFFSQTMVKDLGYEGYYRERRRPGIDIPQQSEFTHSPRYKSNDGMHPGLAVKGETGYIPYVLGNDGVITVDKRYWEHPIGIAYTGLSVDKEGYPMITRKQANALAAISAKTVAIIAANKGDKNMASMLEFYSTTAARLKQAASIPEDITDNEIDSVLDAMSTFNRKSVNRPIKYSR